MVKDIDPKLLRFFALLSDETRLRIVMSIREGPLSVGEIHERIKELTLSAISHQLRTLNDAGIIDSKKEGRTKRYSLTDQFCWCILDNAFSHFQHKHCEACRRIR